MRLDPFSGAERVGGSTPRKEEINYKQKKREKVRQGEQALEFVRSTGNTGIGKNEKELSINSFLQKELLFLFLRK